MENQHQQLMDIVTKDKQRNKHIHIVEYKSSLKRNLPYPSANTSQLVMVSGKDYVNRSRKAIDSFRLAIADVTDSM